ncbi:MAG TPA: Maf family nucleotide pyrophosphatase [Pseudomonadales bacterium]|nr:Maf family nucleotide pyrophosphatase [Pseudomonadales bacterium]
MPKALLLASTSVHRRALLERLRLPFEVEAPDVDETPLAGESPQALALRLAEAKARRVAERHAGAELLVIGSDQVAELDGTAIGKPGGEAANIAQLERASGRWVRFHTGLALVDATTGDCRSCVEVYGARFRVLSAEEIRAYVRAERPYDAAGGFYSEGLGIALFEAFEGRDPNTLVGLPLMALVDLLAAAGLPVLAEP